MPSPDSDFCPDDFWNSSVTWVETDPRLTVCFQQTVLIWTPCGILFLFALLDIIWRSQSRYSRLPWSFLNISKSILVVALIVLTFIDMTLMLMERSDGETDIYDVQIVSVSVKAAAFLLVLFLQIYHKAKGHRTSGLLFIFWLVLVVLAIPQLIDEIREFSKMEQLDVNSWLGFQYVNYIIYFSLASLMLLLNCFADKAPLDTTYAKYSNPSPELSASFLRKIFFQWFDKTTWAGWRKPLTEADMYDINPADASRELVPPFDKYFLESVEKGRRQKQANLKNPKKSAPADATTTSTKTANGSILPAMFKAFGGPFWFAGLLQIFLNVLTFSTPLILNELILYTTRKPDGTYGPLWQGLVFTFALFLSTFLSSIFNGQFFWNTFVVGFRIRSALISAIYRKSLRISSAAKKDTTVGEIVNLMAVDAQGFFELVSYLHVLWSAPLVIGVAIWMLWAYLGVAVVSGLVVMVLMVPVTGVIAGKLREYQVVQMKVKDERVKSMNEILNGMKVLKLYAWEPSFEKQIFGTREKEMGILRSMALLNAGTYFVWSLAPFLVSLASYITFVLLGGHLTPNVAFVTVTLFNILRFPMAMFPMMIAFLMQSWVSVKRINKFMNAEEIDPNNVTHNPSANALEIHNGTFTWGGETTTLRNIHLRVKKGNLTALVGAVGCGKTSVISALLGEMEKISGEANVDGKIAYVSQQAWIQNASLQDNILFGRPMNKPLYDEVIAACALKADLAMLPGGDQTEIGEKGINLSGGQKQRVSLARAVYANADVYILDDPLSAVDSHVGKHIFDNVFSENGMLKDKTRLLVTHAVVYLPKVDEIYVMVNGEITENGSYKELLMQKGAFSEFLAQHLQELDDDEELLAIQNAIQDKETKALFARSVSTTLSEKSSLNGSMRRRRNSSRRSSQRSDKIKLDTKPKSKLIDSEEAATGAVGLGVYIRYFKSIGIFMGLGAIACNAIQQACSVYSSIWLSDWSTDPRAYNETAVRNLYMGVYGGLGAAQAFTLLATSVIFAIGCLRAARDLHDKLLINVFRLPMSFYDTTPLGRILNRFSKDVNTIDSVLPMSMRFWIMMFFNTAAVLVVISYSTPWFMTLVLPLGAIYYFVQRFYVATSRQLKRIESVTRSPIYTHFSETITGQSTIRAYGEETRFTMESESRVDYNQMMSYPSIIANRWLAVRLELLGAVIVFAACLFAVLARATISPAIVGLSISYALQISQVLSFLVRMTAEVETNIVAIERVDEYSDVKQEAAWKTIEMDPAWPKSGIVKFENFQLRYREGLDLVLRGINFSVKSEEKIGIVGRTGAGKSSLTLALFRIIEASDGKIIIDDVDISKIGLHSLRSRLTIIPQDPVLFSGSLRMNIDPFNTYSDDAVWMALEDAHLKLFVKGLSDGLMYKIAEGGENLSVGQRQLVCLARALLRKTKVLILDEATAAIDLETDELIQKTIRTKFTDCTILTIAHRLNTIMDSDRIIVLDQGKIAEFDSPANLLADKQSIFYGMAKNAGLVNNPNEMTIDEVIDEAFRYDENDDTKL